MSQKIDIKLWLSTNAEKVTGKVKQAVGGLKNKFEDATGTVIEMGSRLESLESVGAKSVGSISEALNGLMAGGVIGMISSGVVLLVQNLVEAKKAAEEMEKELAEGFAAAAEKIGAVGQRVRLEGLTEDLDYALEEADQLKGKLEALKEEREIAASIEEDKAVAAHQARLGKIESERLRLRSVNGDEGQRQLIDLSAASDRVRAEVGEQERLAEQAVKAAKDNLELAWEERDTHGRRVKLLEDELKALIKAEKRERSVEGKKAVRALQRRAEDGIARYKAQQERAALDAWKAEAALARATNRLAAVRTDGANKIYAAEMATADAVAAQKKAAEEKAAADRQAAKEKRVADLKARQAEALKAVADAKAAVVAARAAVPANAEGVRIRGWMAEQQEAEVSARDEEKARLQARKRMRYLENKQRNSLYRGRLTRAQREELGRLQKFFGPKRPGKDAAARLVETNKELAEINRLLEKVLKVG